MAFAQRVGSVVRDEIRGPDPMPPAPRGGLIGSDLPDVISDLLAAIAAFEHTTDNEAGESEDPEQEDAANAAAVALARTAERATATIRESLGPEDTCTVGDPDPTPVILDDRDQCGAQDPTYYFGIGLCTRLRGHRGRQHVSGNGTQVKRVWPWRPTGSGDATAGGEPR